MNALTITNILIIAIVLIVGILFVAFSTLFSGKRIVIRKVSRPIESVSNKSIDKFNNIQNTFSEINRETSVILMRKKNDVVMAGDIDAYTRLRFFVDKYNHVSDLIVDYLKRSCDCLNQKDYSGSDYCLDQVESYLDELKLYSDSISKIEIKENFEEQEQQTVEPTPEHENISSFFNGCSTKEEITARYRSLSKAFHPDNKGGSAIMFNKLQEEYRKING